MKVKCVYCNSDIEATLDKCPNCAAPNANIVRMNADTPGTMEELKEWYKSRNLPPESETRFFIGKNIQEPRAFGIYKDQDTGEFVVYKNKGNGERAVRYRGMDEAYAVNELYLKLKSEIINQKRLLRVQGKASVEADGNKVTKAIKNALKGMLLLLVCMVMFVGVTFFSDLAMAFFCSFIVTLIFLIVWSVIFNGTSYELKSVGQIGGIYCVFAIIIFVFIHSNNEITYYKYEDTVYCHARGYYYEYDDSCDDYLLIGAKDALPIELQENLDAYEWDAMSDSRTFTEFEDSKYFDENFTSSSDSDSDFDWDSDDSWDSDGMDWDSDDSWDSGGMDWDSDW